MAGTPAAAAVIVSAPVAAGVPYVTTGLGTTDGFDDTAVTVSACVSLAAPVPMPASGTVNGTPTVAVLSGGASIVGRSLTGAIVRRNVFVVVRAVPPTPAVTVTATSVQSKASGAGVNRMDAVEPGAA